MKINRFIIVSMILLAILFVGVVSAADNTTTDNAVLETTGYEDSYLNAVEINDEEFVSSDTSFNEEIIVDYTTVEKSNEKLGLSNNEVITPENINEFDNGIVPNGNYTFEGTFNNPFSNLIFDEGCVIDGNNATFVDMGIVLQGNVEIDGLTLTSTRYIENNAGSSGALVYVTGDDNVLKLMNIKYSPSDDKYDVYGVLIENANNFQLLNSIINFTGTSLNDTYEYAMKIVDCEGSNVISGNTIIANLPILEVDYTAGNPGLDTDFVLNTGIKGSSGIDISGNSFIANVINRSGDFPTLDCVMLERCSDINITGNVFNETDFITSIGDSNYLNVLDMYYSSKILVKDNQINVETTGGSENAGTSYPIQLTGPYENVVIDGNNLYAHCRGPALGIFSQNYYGDTEILVQNNNIDITGLPTHDKWGLVSGIELQDNFARVYNNTIKTKSITGEFEDGMYLFGISYAQTLNDDHCYDIQNNTIETEGKYAIYLLKAEDTIISGNSLVSSSLTGDESVYIRDASGNTVIENNYGNDEAENIVTQKNFFDFFDDEGFLKDNILFDELIFKGNFENLVERIYIPRPITITGRGAILNNIAITIFSGNVKLEKLNFISDTNLDSLISIKECEINLTDLNINYNVSGDDRAVAIDLRECNNVNILNCNVVFESHVTSDAEVSVAIQAVDTQDVLMDHNNITTKLPCVSVNNYDEDYYLMGSNNVNPVRLKDCNNLIFTNNNINSTTNNCTAEFPTIQSIYIIGCSDSLIDHNNISMIDEMTPSGMDNYMYGIDFGFNTNVTFSYNNFVMFTGGGKDAAGSNYAFQGVESEVIIRGNNITSKSYGPNLGIYVASMFGDTSELLIEDNFINVTGSASSSGNWALVSGIEIQNGNAKIYNNTIYTYNVNKYDDEAYMYGISYAQWMYGARSFDIQDNVVYTEGKYTISIINADFIYAEGNTLYAHELTGVDSINPGICENVVIVDGADDLDGVDIYVNGTTITDGDNATIKVLSKMDGVICSIPVVVNVNGVNVTSVSTSDSGWLEIVIGADDLVLGINNVTVYFEGNSTHNPANAITTINVEKDKKVTCDVEIENITYGDSAILKITNLKDAYGKELSVYGGFQLVGPTNPYGSLFVSKGKCSANLGILPAGNYSAWIVFGNSIGGDYQFENYVVNFTVFKSSVNLTANVDGYDYGKTGNLNVKVADAKNRTASGAINVTIDGVIYASNVAINGEVNIPLENLTLNNHTAVITFYNQNYEQKTINATLNVVLNLRMTYLNATDLVMEYGDGSTWDIKLTDEDGTLISNATIKVGIGGNVYEIVTEDGVVKFPINLTPGVYEINATFEGSGKYKPSFVNATVTVNKLNPNITVSVESISVGQDALIEVSFNENATGVVTVSVYDKTFTMDNFVNGKANVSVSNLSANDYIVTATFKSSSIYYDDENSTKFTVSKIDSEIAINIDNDVNGANITVSIPGATGDVNIIVNDEEEIIPLDENGNATYAIENIKAGDYYVNVIYPGDKDHSFAYKFTRFTIDKLASDVNLTVSAGKAREKSIVKVNVTQNATGIVIINVNGSEYAINLTNGNELELVLDAGEYLIVATYMGDEKYNASVSDTKTINIEEKLPANINIQLPEEIKAGETITINITCDSNAELIVIIDGEEQNVTYSNGPLGISLNNILKANNEAKVTFKVPKAGSYNITVIAKENENYTSQSVSKIFEVSKNDAVISIDDVTAKVGDKITISLQCESDGNLTIKINGEKVTGEYEIKKAGEYTINVESAETDLYKAGFASYTFNVPEEVVPEPIVPSFNVTISDDNSAVAIALPENATGNVTVKVDEKEVANVSLVNGTANIPLYELSEGVHLVEVAYAGDDRYAPLIVSKAVSVANETKPIEPAKIATVIESEYKFTRQANDYNVGERGAFFYAVLKDINGKPLANMSCYVAVNGPIYNVTTDEQGRFGVQVNLAAANTYTYALSFLGNDQYGASFNCSKLILTAKKTSITAKAQTFKAKAKTKTVSVTLKTVKNPYDGKTYLKAGKKITLRINGKTYTAKTNSKGVAKFTINLTKKGKYAATVKFAGDKTYKASSQKVQVIIK